MPHSKTQGAGITERGWLLQDEPILAAAARAMLLLQIIYYLGTM